jgi:hypothetical protein
VLAGALAVGAGEAVELDSWLEHPTNAMVSANGINNVLKENLRVVFMCVNPSFSYNIFVMILNSIMIIIIIKYIFYLDGLSMNN